MKEDMLEKLQRIIHQSDKISFKNLPRLKFSKPDKFLGQILSESWVKISEKINRGINQFKLDDFKGDSGAKS